MTSPSSPLLTDRTTIETDWDCGMKRWWYKEEGGQGIVPAREADYFLDGRNFHLGMAELARGVGIEEVLELLPPPDSPDQIAWEAHQRLHGLLAAYAQFILPEILRDYEILLIEHEVILERDPLWVAATPDLVLRARGNGSIIIRDYKTVGWLSKSWSDHWPYAIQLHLLIRAVEEELGEKVRYAQIMGAQKGQVREGKLRHPYVWAYSDGADLWQDGYKKELSLRPLWEYNRGILDWTNKLGIGTARTIFPFSPPVFADDRLLAGLIRQRIRREEEVKLWKEEAQINQSIRERFFEPRYSHCRPTSGSPCPYLAACHNAVVNADPLGSGLYIPRTPHHDVELISLMGGEEE